jgi:lipopolysaccharide export LptBFGC system permease protein LptF
LAYQMPYLLRIDRSGRAGIQLVTAQCLGMAVGPELGSLTVSTRSVIPSAWASIVLFLAALAILGLTLLMSDRRSAEALRPQ